MEISVSETTPGPSGIKTEPKEEDCEDLLSAFKVEPPPVKIENDDSENDEYGSLSEDYTVDIKKLKTEQSDDSKEWLKNYRIKSEENDQLPVSGEDQDDDFTEDNNIKSEEMHIKEDDGIDEPGMSSNSCLPNNEDITEDEWTPTTKTEFHCHKCQYKTIEEPNLKRHLLFEHTTLKCNECSFETGCKRTLVNHFLAHKKHRDAELFKCSECTYKTHRKYNLKVHLLRHSQPNDVTSLKCEDCSYKTVVLVDFNKHLRRHKQLNDKEIFKCPQCHFKTHVKDQLKKHLLRHGKEGDLTPYQCNLCSYKTYKKPHFQDHLLRHGKSKAVTGYQCIHCSYKTAIKSDLKKHSRKHDDTKLIKCPKCFFRTHRQWNLKIHHLLQHTK